MLTETFISLGQLSSDLHDADITASGEWVGVTSHSVIFESGVVDLPQPVRFPRVAAIDSETAVVVNCRSRGEDNAWIIKAGGGEITSFFAGDAVAGVIASGDYIIVTYFDESAASGSGMEGNGVVVFDTTGEYLFGYREVFAAQSVDVFDCYAVCWAGRNQIYFFSYTDFPLVLFDLANKIQKKWDTPAEVHGAHAITAIGSTVYFHGPYNDKPGMYAWQIGNERAERIGQQAAHLRGIRSGKFISVGTSGFTIVTPSV